MAATIMALTLTVPKESGLNIHQVLFFSVSLNCGLDQSHAKQTKNSWKLYRSLAIIFFYNVKERLVML